MAIILDGTAGIDTPALDTDNLSLVDVTVSNDINFTGTGNRILGDFSSAPISNRVAFQNSTTNGQTVVGVIPNGTSTSTQLHLFSFPDYTNYSRLAIQNTGTAITFLSDFAGTGSYLPVTFNTGGAERLRIDTSGNVGIGTSSPAAKLNVVGGRSYFASNSDNFAVYLQYNSSTSGFFIGSPAADTMAFSASSGAERMRIDASGKLSIGSTGGGNGVKLEVVGDTAPDALCSFRDSRADGYAGAPIMYFQRSGTVGSITTTTSSTSYNTSSDYRLKENIAPMTGALDTVAQLKPVTYNWKADGSAGQGFIAHELQAVVPDCVTGEKDAVDEEGKPVYQGIDTSFLVATLTKAIQEQQALIENLTTRLNALEGK